MALKCQNDRSRALKRGTGNPLITRILGLQNVRTIGTLRYKRNFLVLLTIKLLETEKKYPFSNFCVLKKEKYQTKA